VGLALGFALLELRTKVYAVAVTDARFSTTAKAGKLFSKAISLLRELDRGIPEVRFEDSNFALRHDFFGGEYGLYTQAGVDAVHQVKDDVGLSLEGCYTGKCAAAMLDDLRLGRLEGQRVVFWNTYDAHGAAHALQGLDYHRLPRAFHRYFERDVQAFDRD
jgi:1-aminocyclopropane-1-carboxylate deaminase/D-cysteine desulfhydrase-like pyridoxal-dependent ACC family enzyme